ncbi:unnamed protein product [Prorocentrum cordatum]|uniref:Phosphoglycerate kinase n=1 Tax=Prorocentrum cordatum TaxID=2364126 RepID=A0ABN9VER3_9DINO|nr:unnamed protein product [Polarella glacialis]
MGEGQAVRCTVLERTGWAVANSQRVGKHGAKEVSALLAENGGLEEELENVRERHLELLQLGGGPPHCDGRDGGAAPAALRRAATGGAITHGRSVAPAAALRRAATDGGRSPPGEREPAAVPSEAPAQAVARLRRELGRPRCVVCVIGGTALRDPASEKLVEGLAKGLMAELGPEAAFVTGGMPGVQALFAESCSGDPRLWNLVPFGDESACPAGRDVHAGEDLQRRQQVFGELGDVYVAVEGGQRVALEARAAAARGARVVPLARTGGASSGLFGFPEEALRRPPGAKVTRLRRELELRQERLKTQRAQLEQQGRALDARAAELRWMRGAIADVRCQLGAELLQARRQAEELRAELDELLANTFYSTPTPEGIRRLGTAPVALPMPMPESAVRRAGTFPVDRSSEIVQRSAAEVLAAKQAAADAAERAAERLAAEALPERAAAEKDAAGAFGAEALGQQLELEEAALEEALRLEERLRDQLREAELQEIHERAADDCHLRKLHWELEWATRNMGQRQLGQFEH